MDVSPGSFGSIPALGFAVACLIVGVGWGVSGGSNPTATLVAISAFALMQATTGATAFAAFSRAAIIGWILLAARIAGEWIGRLGRDNPPQIDAFFNLIVASIVVAFLVGLIAAAAAAIAHRIRGEARTARTTKHLGYQWFVSAAVALIASIGLAYGHWRLYEFRHTGPSNDSAAGAAHIYRVARHADSATAMEAGLFGAELLIVLVIVCYAGVSYMRLGRRQSRTLRAGETP